MHKLYFSFVKFDEMFRVNNEKMIQLFKTQPMIQLLSQLKKGCRFLR